MKRVTEKELEVILSQATLVEGMPTFATIWQFVDARLKKTNNPFRDTKKLSKVSVILNSEYKRALHLQLDKENKEREEYKQGKNTMVVEKCEANNFFGYFQNKAVIEYRPNDQVKPRTKYVHETKIVGYDKIKDFMPSSNKATNQGTDREILWRKIYLSNVREITLLGERYKVIR
jgi:hypothetical protein